MAVRTTERDIDGLVLISTQLDAVRASRLLVKLGKVLGPCLAQLASVIASRGNVADLDVGELGPLLGEAFAKLDDLEHDRILLAIFAGTEAIVDGKKQNLLALDKVNRAFDGRLGALYKAVWFVLVENYADFFPAAAARSPSAAEPGSTTAPP